MCTFKIVKLVSDNFYTQISASKNDMKIHAITQNPSKTKITIPIKQFKINPNASIHQHIKFYLYLTSSLVPKEQLQDSPIKESI